VRQARNAKGQTQAEQRAAQAGDFGQLGELPPQGDVGQGDQPDGGQPGQQQGVPTSVDGVFWSVGVFTPVIVPYCAGRRS